MQPSCRRERRQHNRYLLFLCRFFETKPARVQLPSSCSPSTRSFTSSSSRPAQKRWRLMNSAPMHASANCIGIGNSSQYYKMCSPSRWPPSSVTLRRLTSFCCEIMTTDRKRIFPSYINMFVWTCLSVNPTGAVVKN